jgi:hypothetical protein
MNPQRPSTILKLEPNTPTELALQYSNGMNVTGKFGPQVLFTLTGGRRLYVPQEVGEEIRALTLAPGQPFIITKATINGERGLRWTVERKPVQALETRHGSPDPVGTATQIEHALKTAIAAACSAEKFATEIGYTVRFSEESIKSLSCTVLISMERAA